MSFETIKQRADKTEQWLKDNASHVTECQFHLDNGSIEQAYWHYGYLMALRDVLTKFGVDKGVQ